MDTIEEALEATPAAEKPKRPRKRKAKPAKLVVTDGATTRQPLACFKPGLHCGMSNDTYHAMHATNASTLKVAGLTRHQESPRKWLAYHQGAYDPPGYALYFGSARHVWDLEPKLRDRVIEVDKFTNPKTGRDVKFYENQKPELLKVAAAQHPGYYPVQPGDIDRIKAMSERLTSHPIVGEWLSMPAMREAGLVWVDEQTGLNCKAKLDWLIETPDEYRIIDLKTTQDATSHDFERSMAKFGYYMSLAHYRHGIRAVLNPDKPARVYIIAQEKASPHDLMVHEVDYQWFELGEAHRAHLMALYAICYADNHWPGLHEHDPLTGKPITEPNYIQAPPLWLLSQWPEIEQMRSTGRGGYDPFYPINDTDTPF